MTEPHVVSALIRKRAELAGQIRDLERKIERQRVSLANLDATIRLFDPEKNPDAIRPKRRNRRTLYFARNEFSRLTLDALRLAPAPISAADITGSILRVKNMPPDDEGLKVIVNERVLTILRKLHKRGAVTKAGVTRNAVWAAVPELL
jgi:hypothetical protein